MTALFSFLFADAEIVTVRSCLVADFEGIDHAVNVPLRVPRSDGGVPVQMRSAKCRSRERRG